MIAKGEKGRARSERRMANRRLAKKEELGG